MIKGKKLIIALTAGVVLAIVLWALVSGGQEVQVIKAQKGTISRQVQDAAIVQPVEDEKIYASQSARIVNMPVEIGQEVVKGQVLMQMKNSDLEMQLSETRSRLAQTEASATSAQLRAEQMQKELTAAQNDYKRQEALFKQGAISQGAFEQAKLKADNAESDLKQQKSLLVRVQTEAEGLNTQLKELTQKGTELEILSPIDGQILELSVKKAQPVTAGSLLVAVGSSQHLELKADLLSDDLAEVKIGQRVFISATVLGSQPLTGRVTKIYPRAEEKMSALGVAQRRVPIIIEVNNQKNLKPGYEVRVAIETKRLDDIVLVPIESVRSISDQNKQVMLVKQGRVAVQKVKTGISDQNHVQITDGLKPGDTIIRDANLEIKPKTRVKELPK